MNIRLCSKYILNTMFLVELFLVIWKERFLLVYFMISMLLFTCFIYNYCMALTSVQMFMAFEKLARKAKNDNYICFSKVLFNAIMEIEGERVHQSGLHLEDIKEDLLGLACLELIA